MSQKPIVRVLYALSLAFLFWTALWVALSGPAQATAQPTQNPAAVEGDVIVNEVGWMGTDASAYDEWIELYNNTESDLDLSGWSLSDGGDVSVTLSGIITAGGYYLLERSDDDTVSDVLADQIYAGNLTNAGESLSLRDPLGALIDSANGDGGGWPAGDNTSPKRTMERIDPTSPDDDPNWADNDGLTRNGLDANGQPINGTPKALNSAYQPPLPPEADLIVHKSGPTVAQPGVPITYSLSLSNAGRLTATAVRLTDTLPAAVAFLTQTSPYPFTQPNSQTLVWGLGDVPTGGLSLRITVSGQLSGSFLGPATNSLTATTRASESLRHNNVATWTTQVVLSAAPLDVVINEVGWMGTEAHYGDEWIELHNTTESDLDLGGWTLSDGGDVDVALSGVITAGGYYLLERADDGVITDVVADLIYAGNLANAGETLNLRDPLNALIDSANGDGGGWPAGIPTSPKHTMERIDPAAPDADPNWASNDGIIRNGQDRLGDPINGTPRARNSAYAPPPPPEADLVVAKSGPLTTTPGALITYSLRLSNTGSLVASGVRLTDTLPTAVTFLTQTSPYPFTQPNSQTLVWGLGDVPAGSLPLRITVSGQLSGSFVGPMTNLVSATTRASESLRHNNVATWTTQVVLSAAPLDVVINEVGWMGTEAHYGDEWIELHNTTESDLDLGGWTLSDGGDVDVALSGVITAGGYYLLERADDGVITDVVADLIYAGNLANAGETLNLRDPLNALIDSANGDGGGWPAGIPTSPKHTMERIDPAAPDADPNWASNDGIIRNGQDRLGDPINGTPRARNSAYAPPPPPEADLVVAKSGPLTTTPGALITYSLRLSNTGSLVASGVRLTDTLPAAVTFLTQTARWEPIGSGGVFTFSQSGGDLFWTVGDLPPDQPPIHITVTGQVSGTAWGALENGVRATTLSTETITGDNVATWTTVVGGVEARVLILAVLADGYVPTSEDDEAVQLINVGSLPVDLSGWRLNDSGDDTSYASFGPALGAVLPPGGRIWLTDDATEFQRSFGFRPDYETAGSDPTVPDLDGNWPGYSNGGDEVVLLDDAGAIVDALIYGDGDPDEVGADAWQGAPLAYLDGARDNGQIFRRKVGPLIERPYRAYLPVVLRGSGGGIAGSTPYQTDGSPGIRDTYHATRGTYHAPRSTALRGLEDTVGEFTGRSRDCVYRTNDCHSHESGNPTVALDARLRGHDGFGAYNDQFANNILETRPTQHMLDTNTESDWIESQTPGTPLYGPVNEGDLIGKRPEYPGWTSNRFSHTLRVTTTARLTVAVAPDNSYNAIVAQLQRAQESVYLEGYALTNIHFGRVISDLIAHRGISVTVLLDTATYSENREKWICQQIEAVGGRVYLMHNLDDTKRYANQHAKFIIVDERVVVIGSENYGYGAMPVDDKRDGTFGNRGAILITDAEPVVGWALEIFRADADPARRDVVRWGNRPEFGPPPLGYTPPVTTGGGTGYSVLAPEPLTLQGEMFFEVIQSPETSLSYERGLIGLLRQAGPGDTVLVEMLNENKHWGGVGGTLADDPNPRLEAYVQAARQGASVRVLLDEGITYGGNQPAIDYLNATALTHTLDLEARSTNPTGKGIHNKMILAQIDGRGYVLVSSINGTVASNRRNRELGLLVRSDEAYHYLKQIFDFDWQPVKRLYLPVVTRAYVPPARYPLISEILYDPVGAEPNREWIELHNPTGLNLDLSGYRLGDAAARNDYEGMFVFPAGASLPSRETLVVAVQGTAFREVNGFDPDFELVESDPAIPNLSDDPNWGEQPDYISLGNGGDEVLLLDPGYAVVDVLAYGTGSYPGVVSYAGPLSFGHSLERYPAGLDSDDCNRDFRDQALPSPGEVP